MPRTWLPKLPIAGVVTGKTTLNGSTATEFAMNFEIAHDDRGETSKISGSAVVHANGPTRIDADVVAYPISLVEVGRFFPSAGLQGEATGPIHLHGPLSDLLVDTDLHTPDGGSISSNGTLDSRRRRWGTTSPPSLSTFNLSVVDSKAPVTSLTAMSQPSDAEPICPRSHRRSPPIFRART